MADPTPHQLAEALRRRDLVLALPRFASLQAAARELGEPVANLCRYRRAWDGTLESLMPATDRAGRPPLVGQLSEEEVGYAKRLYLQTESLPLAIEHLADSALCSHASRDLLNRYRDSRDYPPSIVKALRITEEEWALYKGRKQFQGAAYATRRGMFEILEDGTRREIVSGDINEQDDVSVDTPYFVTLPDGTHRTGRQILVSMDLRSGKYLGAEAVARERDSYRAEDVVRFNRRLTEAHGLFGRLRLERGAWDSIMVKGHALANGEYWGGLAQLIPVQTVFSSNGKGRIEQGFRMLHKLCGLHGVRIGKKRGEYEQPTADMLAVNAGTKDPRACGFIAWSDLLRVLEKVFTTINGRASFDRHSGEHLAPDDIWHRDMQERHAKRLPVCPPELFYHFLPVKREVSVGMVLAGHVQVSVDGYRAPFLFRAAGPEIPYLERGHKVWCCFDPHEAAAGAVIFNADTTARNRGGYRHLERLFVAPFAAERAQVDHRPAGERGPDADVEAKKIRHTQVRTQFTSIGAFGVGARRVRANHDGAGNVTRIETGAAPRSQAPRTDAAPAVQPARTPRAKPAPVEIEDLDTPLSLARGHTSCLPAPQRRGGLGHYPEPAAEIAHAPAQVRPRGRAATPATTVEFEDLDLR